jgi:hypothetical protein
MTTGAGSLRSGYTTHKSTLSPPPTSMVAHSPWRGELSRRAMASASAGGSATPCAHAPEPRSRAATPASIPAYLAPRMTRSFRAAPVVRHRALSREYY